MVQRSLASVCESPPKWWWFIGYSKFGIRAGDNAERDPALEPRRETKAEREARKLERERILRAQERERSLKEEGVDGGYLVTLGVYTGPEDFSKPMVRQLQVWLPSAYVVTLYLPVLD